jgi:hypothetical protein
MNDPSFRNAEKPLRAGWTSRHRLQQPNITGWSQNEPGIFSQIAELQRQRRNRTVLG